MFEPRLVKMTNASHSSGTVIGVKQAKTTPQAKIPQPFLLESRGSGSLSVVRVTSTADESTDALRSSPCRAQNRLDPRQLLFRKRT